MAGPSSMNKYYYDINKRKVTSNCSIKPTDITEDVSYWLYAGNNKYEDEDIYYDKVGKWMIFVRKEYVNSVWDKIKMGITNGKLWSSKVSTAKSDDHGKYYKSSHAIMIYTKDFLDLDDVLDTLNYLESSGIKPIDSVIKYKTDQQTRAGIYGGGARKPWIYSSDTIREQIQQILNLVKQNEA